MSGATEVIVVDDGSTDDTAARLAAFGDPIVVIHNQGRKGRAAARNRGIEEATGEVIAFLDSDDLWFPSKLSCQLPILEERGDIAAVVGHVEVIDARGHTDTGYSSMVRAALEKTAATGFSVESLVSACGVYISTLVLRRQVLNEVGGFDESLEGLEDRDMLIRVAARARLATVPWPPVAAYRRHADNTASDLIARRSIEISNKYLSGGVAREGRARSAFLFARARAQRTLLRQPAALRSSIGAIREAPVFALRAGALRLLLGALVPARIVTRYRRLRAAVCHNRAGATDV